MTPPVAGPADERGFPHYTLVGPTDVSHEHGMSAGTEEIVVRPAEPSDLEPLEKFIGPFVEARRILPRTTDELASLLPTAFVAELHGRIVGFAALEIYSRKLAELRSLAVAEEWQGQGIGSRLVKSCVALARERRIFEIITITSADRKFVSPG